MRLLTIIVGSLLINGFCFGQQTPFEKSEGMQTATYFEAIAWYKKLALQSRRIMVKQMGPTDSPYPLHLVLVSNDGKFEPVNWHLQNKVIVLINNGIHPGEPDGIDASMMFVRDILQNKVSLPNNVVLAFIPVYNIGGSLNRGSFSRVNQNGPTEYGFRGNGQNLDLNRDFTKCDSKEAQSFTQIFHWLNPAILIDNHVSDGADYQHTFTLLTTQYNKLGNELGEWLKSSFEPSLYKGMAQKKWDICPYVNFETANMDNGMVMFYDSPRYSSGYAALFQKIAFVPETHMLKPYPARVQSTYAFMQSVMEEAGKQANVLLAQQKLAVEQVMGKSIFPLSWQVDSSQFSWVSFKGYEQAYRLSGATDLQSMYYNKERPFEKQVKFYNQFVVSSEIKKPLAYIIPAGWQQVINLLQLNNVKIEKLKRDTLLALEVYHIADYKSLPNPYEKHHKNYAVKVNKSHQNIQCRKGDYKILLNQLANRYIIEMLEPTGDDSFFAWNFFDAILQQKEGYSDYRWDDVATTFLRDNPRIKKELESKKFLDTVFAKNAAAQLNFIYKNSPYYEPVHMRYPVFRLEQ